MADKTYKMQVTLTDNRVIDAGTFVAPQGPQGPKGDPGSGGGGVPCYWVSSEGGDVIVTLPTSDTSYSKRTNQGVLSVTDGATSVTLDSTCEYVFHIGNAAGQHIYIGSEDDPQSIDYIAKGNYVCLKITAAFNAETLSYVIFYEAQ